MNEEQFLKAIQFPKETYFLRTFPYNKIEGRLTAAQKKVISEHVVSRGIRILAIIQENNTNIRKFEDEKERYDSIQFFSIKVKQLKKAVDVYKVFANIMPNPLVILFSDEKNTKWVFATHEKKKDLTLAIQDVYEISEDVTIHQVEQQLSFDQLTKTDLKEFYRSWIEKMLEMELQAKYGVTKPVFLENNMLQKLKVMDEQIEYLVGQAKREKQMNKRIALQVEANKLKVDKQALIEKES
ncbi:DUF4391 domain-containing protein [Lysinibacillus sp. BW-2-10]|uniref:DUF4391 domain-containing protein n=1 Tax=Lysinibacillus sp. BW-2-10 TaxID=2590030 RepID=UPI00118109C5|nr:DUF4391 domain-containing protein [Lysinibacillus sp. BW-2-10]TSI07648.1 DUF4391 domain-containing protein [Lysinibacillus sp. BW-2-10]